MVNVRVERKPSFTVSGVKCWISGQDNDLFGRFWDESHKNGTVDKLKKLSKAVLDTVTKSDCFGVSRVEKDPMNRAFDFFIVSENDGGEGLETFTIHECDWAIFTGSGNEQLNALIEAEMYCFMEWLPKSAEFKHAFAPELEVYPIDGGVEFWLPIVKK